MEHDELAAHLVELKVAMGAVHVRLSNIEAAAINLDKIVRGDGQPGIAQRLASLEASRNILWGLGAALTAVGGFLEWLLHRR